MEELKLELFHRPQVGKPAPVLDGIRECRGRHVQRRKDLLYQADAVRKCWCGALSRIQRPKHWLAPIAIAFAIAAAGCDQQSVPAQGATRAPDVAYDPTPHHVVTEMLKLGRVGANDIVYDLGCGDGRIVIAAAKLGARGVCVDIDPQRIRESRANAERAGVTERIVFLNQDLFETDIAKATVVTLFLWPSVNLKLRPKLWRELKPGTRVLSYVHSMGDWPPQEVRNVESDRGRRKLFLWIIAANAGDRARGIRQPGFLFTAH